MNNAATPDGRGRERPNDAEPLFPSEGSFNPVVPLSEIGRAPSPAPLAPVKAADVGKPAEAEWAREAHRAGLKEEEETTLVPARARGVRARRPSWVGTAVVFALSVAAGLAAGAYLVWSSQRAREAQPSPQVVAEAPPLTPAPAAAKVERAEEAARPEKSDGAAQAPKQAPPPQPAPAPRAERVTRAAAEAMEPKPARTQSAAPSRPRPTAAERPRPKVASSERALPITSPPPTAKSKRVIQWP
jgi:hypothetical protein